jgi:hypothetical protein
MKTQIIRFAILVAVIIVTNIFSASGSKTSSDFFSERNYNNEKVVSSTMYELERSRYEKKYLSEYSYDELGNISRRLTFYWNSKKSEWIPNYRIEYSHNKLENSITAEYATWNKKKSKYNDVSDKAIYQMDTLGNILSCIFVKVQTDGMESLSVQWSKSIIWRYN